MMRIIACLSFVLLVSGCGTGQFGTTYTGYLTPEMAAEVVMLGEGQQPILIHSNDMDRDVRLYREHNFIIVGDSAFNGLQESAENALRQASEVSATHVIVSAAYTDSASYMDYDTEVFYRTIFVSNVRMIDGKEVRIREAVTVRDTVSIPYMRYYDNYDQWAVYLVRSTRTFKLGLIMRDLSLAERAVLKRNSGAFIDVVLANSPADLGDIMAQDVLVAVDGAQVNDSIHAQKLIRELEFGDKTIVLTVLKGGEEKDVVFEFGG